MPTERIVLSLILPAFNEAQRLPPYLASVRTHLRQHYPECHEVIVVDDGSRDDLVSLLERAATDWPQLRWIRHLHNQGKGAAVRTGMLAARGELLLFADADGATPINELERLAAAIRDGADVAAGSRLVDDGAKHRSRQWLRGLTGRLFAAAARRLLRVPVRDTQCGFKMFRGDVGRHVFSLVREDGFLFDLEVLARADRLGYKIAEVSVNWREVPGGHFRPLRQLPRILADLWRIRRRVEC